MILAGGDSLATGIPGHDHSEHWRGISCPDRSDDTAECGALAAVRTRWEITGAHQFRRDGLTLAADVALPVPGAYLAIVTTAASVKE